MRRVLSSAPARLAISMAIAILIVLLVGLLANPTLGVLAAIAGMGAAFVLTGVLVLWPMTADGSVALAGRHGQETDPVTSCCSSAFAGFRFPREVIAAAVRWYMRYSLSYRDVEELLAERGIRVDHVPVYRWVQP